MTRISQEAFLYVCTDNFIVTIIHLLRQGKAHGLEELLQVQHRPTLSTHKLYSAVLCLFTLFCIMTSEKETLIFILHIVMQL